MPNELVIPAVVVVAIIAVTLSAYFHYQREAAFARVATSLGLTFSERDDSSVRELHFPLFQLGRGTETGNLVSGTLQSVPVAAFDFAYWTESRDAKGYTHREYHRFLCAVTDVAARCAPLEIAHRNVLGRLAGALGLDGVQFESDEFDRAYKVTCADHRFATALVDPAMMAWLLDAPSPVIFQTVGSHALAAATDRRPESIPGLLHALLDFRAHIPALVGSEYPAVASG
jgi:hypothetical protein